MTDVTQYKPGDVIDLEHKDGTRIVNATVAVPPAESHAKVTLPFFNKKCIHNLLDNGWTVTKHEPKVVLPTENGVYIVNPGDEVKGPVTFVLYEGSWRSTPPTSDAEETARYHAAKDGGLTLLRPVDEVRRETMTELLKNLDEADIAPRHVVRWLRDYRFGLVSE